MKLYNIPEDPKTLIFDIDGTLYTSSEFVQEQIDVQIRHWADLKGMTHEDVAISVSLILRPRVRYAVGAAMNMDDSVPKNTPSIIANEKLRMESPPRMKIQSNTSNVETDVLMVRASVWLIESLNVIW